MKEEVRQDEEGLPLKKGLREREDAVEVKILFAKSIGLSFRAKAHSRPESGISIITYIHRGTRQRIFAPESLELKQREAVHETVSCIVEVTTKRVESETGSLGR